jgi:anaerobic magnesium-protoporphyrin IX monomethyl ester cyclase
MDILLISPDHGNKKNNFPWGILSLGSYLTNVKKREVVLLDASALTRTEFIKELKRLISQVTLVGVGCFTTDVHFVKEIVDLIKEERPDVKLILGGPHAVLEPEQTCSYHNVDFVAYTDGEKTVAGLIEEMEKKTPDYSRVPGLIYQENGKLTRTAPPECVDFYQMDYELLPEKTVQTFSSYIQVLTGRGCSFRCKFCYNSVIGQAFRPFPIKGMIRELERIVEKYNPETIYFRDENFFQDKKRITEFVRLYKDKKFTFSWRATCRVNYFGDKYLNQDFLKALEDINCETLKMGIESGTQRVLNYLRKGIHISMVKRAVRKLANTGIRGNYSFMTGLPGQTADEYIDTIKLIKYILNCEPDAEIIGPQYFRIYPGGKLYEEIVEQYKYKKPLSFEEWADSMDPRKDQLGLYKTVEYSWIPKKAKFLALHGDLLIFLYKKPLRYFLSLRRFPALPFVMLANLRVRHNYYKHLYDIKLLAILYNFYLPITPFKAHS